MIRSIGNNFIGRFKIKARERTAKNVRQFPTVINLLKEQVVTQKVTDISEKDMILLT